MCVYCQVFEQVPVCGEDESTAVPGRLWMRSPNILPDMPAWFDMKSLDPAGEEDEEGIKRAAQQVESLIAKEIEAGIPADR